MMLLRKHHVSRAFTQSAGAFAISYDVFDCELLNCVVACCRRTFVSCVRLLAASHCAKPARITEPSIPRSIAHQTGRWRRHPEAAVLWAYVLCLLLPACSGCHACQNLLARQTRAGRDWLGPFALSRSRAASSLDELPVGCRLLVPSYSGLTRPSFAGA